MGPGEEVCDGSPRRSKMTHINLKKGRMLTPSLGGVTATFPEHGLCFFCVDVLGKISMYPCTMYPHRCPDVRTEKNELDCFLCREAATAKKVINPKLNATE